MSSGPDYPGALWIPAAPSKYRRKAWRYFDTVVIHATDGRGDPRATAQMFARDDGRIASAHFVVGQDGTIVQCVRLTDVAYHAHAANGRSVAVEHCCRTPRELGPDDPGLPPTPIQLRRSAELVAWLCGLEDPDAPARFIGGGPTRQTIRGHAEVDPATSHRTCPVGAGIDLDAYVGLVHAVIANRPHPLG